MSDPKQDPTAPESVDWAERLRASMSAETPEPEPAPTETIPDDEDDLAALLRDQLARQRDAAVFTPLDTSEFESEDEEDEEIEADPPADEDYEEDLTDEAYEEDPVAEACDEDLADEDYDGDYEEDPADKDYEEDPVAEACDEDLTDEDYDEDYDEDLIIDNEDLDIPVASTCYAVLHDTCESANASQEDAPALAFPTTDDDLNGRNGEAMPCATAIVGEADAGDERRRRLREENERLLADVERRQNAADHVDTQPTEGVSASGNSGAPTEASDELATEPLTAARTRPRPSAISYDPLQMGHEAIADRPRRGRSISSILDEEMPVEPIRIRRTQETLYTADMPATDPDTLRVRDAALLSDLGYSGEMHHAEDRRAVETAHAVGGLANADPADADRHVPPRTQEEYTGQDQNAAVTADFRRERRRGTARLITAAVAFLLMLVYDLLPGLLAGADIRDFFTSTVAYPLISLAFSVIIALPFLSRLWDGVRGLCRFAPGRYSVSALAWTVHFLYTCIAVSAVGAAGIVLPLLGGLPLCMLMVAALSEHMDANGEKAAFEIVSAGRSVYVLTDEDTPAAATLGEDPAASPAPLTALRTETVDHVFARMGEYNSYMGRLNYLLPCALLAALVCAGASLAVGGDFLTDGIRVFTAVYLAALPTAYLVAMSLPLSCANRHLGRRGCAVIGTAAPDHYAVSDGEASRADGRKVILADGDLLSAARRKEITLRAGADAEDPHALPAEHWQRMANRLFHLLHSPLAVEIPFEDDGSAQALAHMHVEITEQDTHYLKVYLIDESPDHPFTVEVMLGSHDALSRRGVRLPRRSMEEVYCKSRESHVLYLAFDGRFRIAYAAEYRVDRDILPTLQTLASCGASVVMETYDPMLTDEMLADARLAAIRAVRVVRPDHVEIPRRTCSSGVVAVGARADLAYPLAACCQMKKIYRASCGLAWAGWLLVTVLSLLAVLTGYADWLTSPVFAALQILYAGLAAALTHATINRRALHLTDEKKARSTPAHTDTPSAQ